MFAGLDLVDPKELESMRHQLEDAQRWNTSLQARLGAIQSRGGGVGGAKDSGEGRLTRDCVLSSRVEFEFTVFTGDSLSFIGDQTSYMSICVGEGHDDGLSLLSAPELRQKVSHEFVQKARLYSDCNIGRTPCVMKLRRVVLYLRCWNCRTVSADCRISCRRLKTQTSVLVRGKTKMQPRGVRGNRLEAAIQTVAN